MGYSEGSGEFSFRFPSYACVCVYEHIFFKCVGQNIDCSFNVPLAISAPSAPI